MKGFKGVNGTLQLRREGVAIIRDRVLDKGFHEPGEVLIPYGNICDVKVVPGSLVNGYICVVTEGSSSPSSVFKALKDNHTVIFRLTKNIQAENIKRLINDKIKRKDKSL